MTYFPCFKKKKNLKAEKEPETYSALEVARHIINYSCQFHQIIFCGKKERLRPFFSVANVSG